MPRAPQMNICGHHLADNNSNVPQPTKKRHFDPKPLSFVLQQNCYRSKLGPKLIQSLRPL